MPQKGQKGKKPGRGGGRMHVTNIEEMEMRDQQVAAAAEQRKARRGDSDEDGSGSGSDSDDSGEEGDKAPKVKTGKLKESVFDIGGLSLEGKGSEKPFTNPNRQKPQAEKMIKNKNMSAALDSGAPAEPFDPREAMNRKQKEALEAEARREEYQRKVAAGENEEGRKNLAKLAEVRARREAAAAAKAASAAESTPSASEAALLAKPKSLKKKGATDDSDSDSDEDVYEKKAHIAEAISIEKKAAASAKKKAAVTAAASAEGAADGMPKLKSIDIKKMNPAAMKDALKERGLSTQGQKKDLITRLTEYEAARE
jgi:hypothetical protein